MPTFESLTTFKNKTAEASKRTSQFGYKKWHSYCKNETPWRKEHRTNNSARGLHIIETTGKKGTIVILRLEVSITEIIHQGQ